MFAESTKDTYRTHRNIYLMFCKYMCIPPIPASSLSICMYAAFLARSLKQSSIAGYLNIIGLMHKEFGIPNPLTDNWQVFLC